MRLFKNIGKKIDDLLFGPAYEIEVITGSSEHGSFADGRIQFFARPVEHLLVRRFPYLVFGMIVERVNWGTVVVGIWTHPDNPDGGTFPSHYAKYCKPKHILAYPRPFLEQVPGYLDHKNRVDPSKPLDYDKELVCAR